jgi:hypothetical protein
MTCRFVAVRRIAALSVAITLFVVPIASAQSHEAVLPVAAPANTVLLSPAAFARSVQRARTDVAAVPVGVTPPRVDLLRKAIDATTWEAPRLKLAAPPRNWVTRHKVLAGVLIGVGVFIALCFAPSNPLGFDG